MLKDMLPKEAIQIDLDAKNWQDAVRLTGRKLVECGMAKDSFIEAMVEAVHTLGPYIVLMPGVAMPHARPESGALKTGFSLGVLRNPVEFGNEANDPVDIVICLCAASNEHHVEALRSLSAFLDDDEKLEQVRKAKSPDEIWTLLN